MKYVQLIADDLNGRLAPLFNSSFLVVPTEMTSEKIQTKVSNEISSFLHEILLFQIGSAIHQAVMEEYRKANNEVATRVKAIRKEMEVKLKKKEEKIRRDIYDVMVAAIKYGKTPLCPRDTSQSKMTLDNVRHSFAEVLRRQQAREDERERLESIPPF